MSKRPARALLYRKAVDRAAAAISALGIMTADPERLRQLVGRVELFLWKFLRLRAHDIHLFFGSVEPIEAVELGKEKYEPGKILHFFAERQDDREWEDCMTIGLSLLFAAMRQAQKRGFNPTTAGIFTLQRMLEQAIEPVQDLEDLLEVGAPPSAMR